MPTRTTAGIWTVRADGSDRRQITSTLTGFDATPTWAPSDERIAFIRYYAGDTDIAVVTAAGGEPVRLALPGLQWTPAWSPDGRFIGAALVVLQPLHGEPERDRRPAAHGGSRVGGVGSTPAWIRKP